MHPLAPDPHVEMGEFPRLARQGARRTGRAEAIQRLNRDLPDFASGEDVVGLSRLFSFSQPPLISIRWVQLLQSWH